MFKTSQIILCLLVLLAPPLYARTPAVPLATAAVQSLVTPEEAVFDGIVEAVHQSTVSAQTTARITDVYFDIDDYVPKGSVLFRFRDTEQKARLTQAEGKLADARAYHARAGAEYERQGNLFKAEAGSKVALERAEADFRKAQAALQSAQAAIEEAGEQLEHTVVRAPYSGIVVERHVETGETVRTGEPLMTGLSMEHLRVVTYVPERWVRTIRRLQRARILAPGPDGDSLEAIRITVAPRADPRSHSFEVRLQLPEGNFGLYPGMSVKAAFVTGESRRLVVPAASVVRRSEVSGVYVIDDAGRVSFRQVRLGRSIDAGQQEVLAGLDEHERVATDPLEAALTLKRQQETVPE